MRLNVHSAIAPRWGQIVGMWNASAVVRSTHCHSGRPSRRRASDFSFSGTLTWKVPDQLVGKMVSCCGRTSPEKVLTVRRQLLSCHGDESQTRYPSPLPHKDPHAVSSRRPQRLPKSVNSESSAHGGNSSAKARRRPFRVLARLNPLHSR